MKSQCTGFQTEGDDSYKPVMEELVRLPIFMIMDELLGTYSSDQSISLACLRPFKI